MTPRFALQGNCNRNEELTGEIKNPGAIAGEVVEDRGGDLLERCLQAQGRLISLQAAARLPMSQRSPPRGGSSSRSGCFSLRCSRGGLYSRRMIS